MITRVVSYDDDVRIRRVALTYRAEVVVRDRLVLQIDAPLEQQRRTHVHRPVLAQPDAAHRPSVEDGGSVLVVDVLAFAAPGQCAEGRDAGHADSRTESLVPRDPAVVAAVSARDARFVVELVPKGVLRAKHVQRDAPAATEVVLRLGEQVVVARPQRVLHVGELERDVEVSRPRGNEPPSPATAEAALRSGARVHDAEPERRARAIGLRVRGLEGEHARQPIAVFGGEAPGGERRGAERLDVDDGERAADVLQVERLDELEPVQRDEQLVARAAAHVELGGEVVGRDAGQARHGAVDVLTELRDRLEAVARQRVRRSETRLQEAEVARDDDDLREGERGASHLETEPSAGRSSGSRTRTASGS